jgi:hypothetical protein
MDEITLYSKFRDMAIAHTNPVEWLECHGFGVGYLFHMNLDSFDQANFRKDLFYSEKWYQTGKDAAHMKFDFPFTLMVPPRIVSSTTRKGYLDKEQIHSVSIYVFDLLYNDRNNNKNSAYSKRSREQVWSQTAIIGRQLIVEFSKLVPEDADKFIIMNDGEITEEKVFEWESKRLAGTSLEFKVKMFSTCDVGNFDYEKTYPGQVSNLKC